MRFDADRADTLYSGVPISGSPTSWSQPVHLRLREVERHPDEPRVDAIGVRAPRASSSPRRETSRATSPSAIPSAAASSAVDLEERLLLLVEDARLAHRHRRRVVVVERPPGREHERVLGVGLLDRRLVLDREEPPLPPGQRRRRRVQERRPRDGRGRCTATGSRAPRSGRSGSRTSSARGRRTRSRPPPASGSRASRRRARAPARSTISPVLARLARAVERLAHAVHPPLGVRERAVLLGEARGREDDVRVLRATSR